MLFVKIASDLFNDAIRMLPIIGNGYNFNFFFFLFL